MDTVLKLLIILVFFAVLFFTGFKLYRYLNAKLTGSKTGFQILLYSLLMFVAFAALFFCSLFVLVEVYRFLAANN